MTVLSVRTFPDPILKQKATRVTVFDPSIQQLIDDLLETLHSEPTRAGLAAPQIGVSSRVIAVRRPGEDDLVLINPEIVRRKGDQTVLEGCLSYPGYAGAIHRAQLVKVRGLDRYGMPTRITAQGFLAQVLQHELDHLNGVLYVDHLDSLDDLRRVEPPQAEDTSEPVARE